MWTPTPRSAAVWLQFGDLTHDLEARPILMRACKRKKKQVPRGTKATQCDCGKKWVPKPGGGQDLRAQRGAGAGLPTPDCEVKAWRL